MNYGTVVLITLHQIHWTEPGNVQWDKIVNTYRLCHLMNESYAYIESLNFISVYYLCKSYFCIQNVS